MQTGAEQPKKVGSQREYAEHRGCTEAYISKLKREGKLRYTSDFRVDFEASDAAVDGASDPDKEGVKARHAYEREQKAAQGSGSTEISPAGNASEQAASVRGPATAPGPADTSAIDEERDAPPAAPGNPLYDERLQAQVRILRLDEQRKQLELAEQAGKLIKVSVAQEREVSRGRALRDKLMAIAPRLQADLAAEGDPAACGRMINDEIRAALDEFIKRVAATSGTGTEARAGEHT